MYTFSNNRFSQRKQRQPIPQYPGIRKSIVLGRVYTVYPSNAKCYYLRILLHHVRGPTSVKNIKTVDNVEYPTFQEVCQALGFLKDEQHWDNTLIEAALFYSASHLRELYVIMIIFCNLSNLNRLWNKHKENMTSDILQQHRT